MQNVELKARVDSLDRIAEACLALGAEPRGTLHQADTYFRVSDGRLKLRDFGDGRAELILYHRPDVMGPKRSDYEVVPADPALGALLGQALGVAAVVEKRRGLWMWRNVRIHLDDVKGLGQFIEFEAVVSEAFPEAICHSHVAHLREALSVGVQDLLATSYLEMVLSQTPTEI
ncbi:class IV adenylate cyclase [Candidatus Sumerlaeota bacterium]|nr:class IV adenylate cyclase [Candidatus Sumerlaeota bacterium]